MARKPRPEFVLPPDGSWVGPPVLILQLRGVPLVLDGQKRLDEIRRRGLSTQAPVLTVTSHVDAIKHLVLANEHVKAAAHINNYYPELRHKTITSLEMLTSIHRNKFMPLVRLLKDPAERHKLPRKAMRVVKRVRDLKEMVRDSGGSMKVTLDLLDDVLGEFVND